MEYQDNIFETNSINQESKAYLLESAKWAKFLAIVGFVGYGIMLIASLFMILGGAASSFSSVMDSSGLYGGMGLTGIGFIYLIIVLAFIYPTYCLYQFATKIKQGLNSANNAQVTEAFRNHKSMFKFYGIFVVVMLVIYAIVFIIGIITAASLI